MNENERDDRQYAGQSIILVALALLGLVLFVAISVDISNTYRYRRIAQNAADAAALAGVREYSYQVNAGWYSEGLIQAAMNRFAEDNGVVDTDWILGNVTNDNVEGYYLDKNDNRIGEIGCGCGIPAKTMGIEAVTYITAPTFFGGVFGLDGLPVSAVAASLLKPACGASCVVPIATHVDTLSTAVTGQCFNIWNGDGPGNFGWLNWSRQLDDCSGDDCPIPCGQDDCSAPCLDQNLDPDACHSGFIQVRDYVAGKVGVVTAGTIRQQLKYYIDTPKPFIVVVWDKTNGQQGCGPEPNGLEYRVAGFAEMQLLGYELSQGQGNVKYGHDGTGCVTFGVPPNDGNRLTARFLRFVSGVGGQCKAVGTVYGGQLTR